MIPDAERRHRTLLPHALALLYGVAIAYASLQPFTPWLSPAAGTPFWPFASWPPRWTRFDFLANILAYIPFGLFVALTPRRASPAARAIYALCAGITLSFGLETLQMFLPSRDASLIDLAANTTGTLLGALLAAIVVRSEPARHILSTIRHHVFLPGMLGDVGLALLAVWLAAQINPGIPLFAVTFVADALPVGAAVLGNVVRADRAAVLIEAAQSALQLTGVGLFLVLLLRDRRYIGGAVLLLIGSALLVKGVSAMLLLKPAVWDTWLKPGVSIGIAAGLLVLLCIVFMPRPVQLAACATALLASLLLPILVSDLPPARAPLTLFSWRYGHLLNFNGLTQSMLLAWPLAVSAWLLGLAGRPAWGDPRERRAGTPL
ncbi:MAG: VanZ family protein [Betaproteobacteria bacterium]